MVMQTASTLSGSATSTPHVSVLMSMKNALPYLDQAVSSILSQTFSNWEFVIVDNCSTDASAAVVEAAARTESRIVLLRNERDLGHSGGLNRGLAICRGTWIARMDADDIAMPDRLERQLRFVRDNPDVATTSCLAFYIGPDGRRVGRTTPGLTTREEFRRYHDERLPIGIMHPGALIRRDVIQEAGGYRPEYDPANDIDLWCRISDRHLILVQPEILMEYRVHGGSLSAASYEYGRLKHLWARDSMIARRGFEPEPTWAEFLEARRNAPWWLRLNRWRKLHAKRLYRQSAQNHLSRRRARSIFEMSLSALLQPEYTIPRFRGQSLP
jgi:glycosyltransferase involved in cell wall biosynthesis